MSNIKSSQWIADASRKIELEFDPDFSFIYLPHLDYVLQKHGPEDKDLLDTELRLIDELVKNLVTFYENRNAKVVVISEYGITRTDYPIHLNRILNKAGFLTLRRERNGFTLDCGASKAFAFADHQIAFVFVADKRDVSAVKQVLKKIPEIEFVFDHNDTPEWAKDMIHEGRSGDLICVARKSAWFTYYFWLQDADAPDYAPTVAIHEKPGYDPCELLVSYPKFLGEWFGYVNLIVKAILSQICRLRVIVNATPFSNEAAKSIRGSHGRLDNDLAPLIISSHFGDDKNGPQVIKATEVCEVLLDLLYNKNVKIEASIEA